jgi:hypothetical protein
MIPLGNHRRIGLHSRRLSVRIGRGSILTRLGFTACLSFLKPFWIVVLPIKLSIAFWLLIVFRSVRPIPGTNLGFGLSL